jgi:hypothetical protein
VAADEAFFWSNLEAVFEGRLAVHEFPVMQHLGMACYVDASTFPQIDFRQLLLLYDTLIVSPPLADTRNNAFWSSQELARPQLLKMVEAGRLRFLLKQPEERTDPRLLAAASERNKHAVIGRLTGAAVLAADLVTTANEYTLARPEFRKGITQLASPLASELNVAERDIVDFLLWPVGARLGCLQPLLDRGLMGLAPFSVGRGIAATIKQATGRDLELEALFAADGVHIAHALGATFVPSLEKMQGWHPVRQAIGQRLNFYRSLNSRMTAAWAVNERRKDTKRQLLPPLPLFQFNKQASIDDILALSGRGSTRFAGRALISRLADLSAVERGAEIERLEKELYALQIKRDRRNLGLDTATDTFDIANDILQLGAWPVAAGLKLVLRIVDIARRYPKLDALVDVLQRDIGGTFGYNADLDFLAKVSRVAQLQDPST